MNLVQSLVYRFGCGWRSANMVVAGERREAMKERDGLSDGKATGTWVVAWWGTSVGLVGVGLRSWYFKILMIY
jgi:hypothetical protein